MYNLVLLISGKASRSVKKRFYTSVYDQHYKYTRFISSWALSKNSRKKKESHTRERNKTQGQLDIFTTCERGVYVHFIRLPKQAPLLSGKRRMFVGKIRSWTPQFPNWKNVCELDFRTSNSGGKLRRIFRNHQLLLKAQILKDTLKKNDEFF